MNVNVQEVSPVEKRIHVEIEWPIVAAKLDEAYRELGRGVVLKGFRKGKVPREMLERMFARRVESEVVQKLLNETFSRAAQQHDIQPVADPIVDHIDMKKGTPMSYTARVEVKAPIDPKDYDGIEVDKHTPRVTEDEVARALKAKREDVAEYKKVEGRETLAATDVVTIDLKGEIGDRPITREGVQVDLGSPDEEPLPGIVAALIGAPAQAKDHPIRLTLPAPAPVAGAEEAAPSPDDPKEARLQITVRDAREKILPALDDDFAKDTGEADTLAELKEKLKSEILARKEKEGQGELRKALLKEIISRNPVQVPPVLIDRHADLLARRAQLEMAMRGVDVRGMDETRLKDLMKATAADEIRGVFLVEAIAAKEKIEVTDADFEKRLAELAAERGKSAPRYKAELQKEGRIEAIKRELREEKTLDLLLTRAKLVIKP